MSLQRKVFWLPRALCATAALCVAMVSAAPADYMTVRDAMEFVRVGNPGNAPDQYWSHNNPGGGTDGAPADQEAALYFGAVPYAYDMGKYHVTVEQYTASGLSRGSGTIYTTGDNEPVNYVSWVNAARFTNWLTSGDKDVGVYNTNTWEAMDRSTALTTFGVAYFLPTEDEWYKAAYYDPDSESYYLHGTGSNTAPTAEAPAGGANSANYNNALANWPASGDVSRPTDVGAYTGTTSPYGAYDMAGNVWDWNETWVTADRRGIRGGAFILDASRLRASDRSRYSPTLQSRTLGFRVASIPEPAGATMLLMGAVAALLWRRRRNA